MQEINTTKIVKQLTKTPINYNTYGLWRFHENSIFSENIFGPIFDYTCACGIIRPKNYICPICGVKSESSLHRFIKTSYLIYPFYFIKGYYYVIFNTVKKLLHSNYAYYYDEINNEINYKKVNMLTTEILLYDHLIIATIKKIKNLEYFIEDKLLEHYNKYENQYLTVANQILEYINEKKDNSIIAKIFDKIINEKPYHKIVTNKIKLLPAGFRLLVFNSTNSNNLSVYTNEFNRKYIKLVYLQEQLKKIDLNSTIAMHSYNIIKNLYTQITENVLHYLTKKKGLYRQYLLGRRVDLSYRAVLTGDPNLYINTIAIPYHGFIHIAYIDLLKIMPYDMRTNIEILERAINSVYIDNEIKQYCDTLLKEKEFYVILIRQPTLHLPSTEQFKIIKLHDELVIKTNQIVWNGYNADSDGDTVVIFRIEKDDNFATYNHILLPKGELNFTIEYDALAGYIF